MLWDVISTTLGFVAVTVSAISLICLSRLKKPLAIVDKTIEPEKPNWFKIESRQELARKIRAGEALLLKEARRNYWSDRDKQLLEQAAQYVQAASYIIRRASA